MRSDFFSIIFSSLLFTFIFLFNSILQVCSPRYLHKSKKLPINYESFSISVVQFLQYASRSWTNNPSSTCVLTLFLFFSICQKCVTNIKRRLLLLATSYVMLIYGCRTFSNTVEMILFSGLLRAVVVNVVDAEEVSCLLWFSSLLEDFLVTGILFFAGLPARSKIKSIAGGDRASSTESTDFETTEATHPSRLQWFSWDCFVNDLWRFQ